MSETRFVINLDFKGKAELVKILQEIGAERKIPVDVDLSKAKLGILRDLKQPLQDAFESFRSFATQAGFVISGVRQIYGVFEQTIGTVVRAAGEAEAAGIKLKGSLRATGLEVENNSARLSRFAASLQKVTVYEDDMLRASMAQLQNIARFGDVSQLEKATKAAIGLGNAFGIDLATAMDLVGKAAAGNTSMLGRYGIVLDETATQAEKFGQVLQIGMGYFPLAEEYAQSQMGSMEQLKNVWGDFLEVLGEGVLPVIQDLTNTLKPLIEAATAMSGEQKAMTVGLIILNALWIKSALAIMSQRAAFAALTIEQQKQVASMIMVLAVQKGAVLTSLSFSGAMKGLGAAFVAAGNGVKAFLASIGPVGWIIIGITAAYAGLTAIFKKNTAAMRDGISASKEALEMANDELQKKKDLANSTVKLASRYEELASKAKRSSKEQAELKGVNDKLQERYPALINSTGSYASKLDGVRIAAKNAKGELASLGRQMWNNSIEIAKLEVRDKRIEAFEVLKEFGWLDVAFTGARATALAALSGYKKELLSTADISADSLRVMATGFESLAGQTSHFTQREEAALQKAANLLRAAAIQKESIATMEKSGPPKEEKTEVETPGSGGGGGKEETKETKDDGRQAAVDRMMEQKRLEDAKFNQAEANRRAEIEAIEKQYEKEKALFSEKSEAFRLLRDKQDADIAAVNAKYDAEREKQVAEHYDQVKFYDSSYSAWKLAQIEKEGEQLFPVQEAARQVWIDEQKALFEAEKASWDNRPIEQFEAAYNDEMSHLSDLREMGLATYGEIADKSWEYYRSLKAIVEADGEVTQAEKDLLKIYLKRAQAAQLAVNRDSDQASYYNEMKFGLDDYYDYKHARIEEDVDEMDVSAEEKANLLKKRLGELDLEQHESNQKPIWNKMMDDLGVDPSQQQMIIGQFQVLADQISSIWNQLYANLDAAKQESLDKLEQRAKKERKTDVWLAAEKEKINAEYEKKVREMKKAEQAMQIVSAIMNTAEGVTNALTIKPAWLAPIMAAAIGALGVGQIALISQQKFAQGGAVKPGLFRGAGTSTSDSNLIAVSDNEYIMSARRVRELGLPLLDALNFGNQDSMRAAMAAFNYRLNRSVMNPTSAVVSNEGRGGSYSEGGRTHGLPASQAMPQNVVLVCDGRELARAVARGVKRIRTT